MKRTLVGVVLAFVGGCPLLAQSTTASPKPAATSPIIQWFDIATPEYVAGWALDRRTGAMPNHLDVLDITFDPATCPGIACAAVSEWREVNLWTNLDRPDVQGALSVLSTQPLSRYTGYGLSFKKPLASGRHYVTLFWNEGLTNTATSFGVVIDVP